MDVDLPTWECGCLEGCQLSSTHRVTLSGMVVWCGLMLNDRNRVVKP